jgi:hypothetical protein
MHQRTAEITRILSRIEFCAAGAHSPAWQEWNRPTRSPDRRIIVLIRVDKSWQKPNEILIPFAHDEHKHDTIYAEAFYFLRDFIVLGIVSQKSFSVQRYPFSLKPARVLRQPQKLFHTIIEWYSPERGYRKSLIGLSAIQFPFEHF